MKQSKSARGWARALFLSVLSAALFTAGFVNAQAPTSGGRIAFINPEGRLATIAPDGSSLRVLSEAGRFQFPAWSPNGGMIATIAADADGAAVYVLPDEENAAPAELYRSANEPPIYLYWSPGGETVSFTANRSGEDGGGTLGFHLAPLEGSSRLLATGNPFYWDWSADGESVFVHTGFVGEGARLEFLDVGGVDAGTGAAENLAPPGFFQVPGISPSGRFVAYAKRDELGGGRVVVRGNPRGDGADEAAEEAVREVPHQGLAALGWSPTEDVLAFSAPPAAARSFYGPVRLLDAETGELTTLADDLSVAFFWSPDGRYLAYLSPEVGGGGGVASGPTEALVALQTQPQLPSLNVTVVEVPSGEVRLRTSFLPTPLFLGQFLPFFDQYALSHALWSPESDALVLPTFETGEPRLLVLPLEGEARTIAAGDTPFWSR